MVEGVLVLPLIVLVFAALVEFGFAVFQWNQTVKAMQIGARLAAVSDPIADLSYVDTVQPTEGGPTDSPLSAPRSISCSGSQCFADDGTEITFDAGSMDWLIEGSVSGCDPSDPRPGMCDFNPRIDANTVTVTYHLAGLGYVGRPDGPVVTITVSIDDLRFDLPVLGELLGINQFEIPANPVTVTSEDLCTDANC